MNCAIHTKVYNLAIKWDKLSIQETTRMNLKCIMLPRLKTHVYYDSISISFSKKGRLPEWKTDQQLSNAREGPRMGTTNHKAHKGTQESVEVLNV